LLTQNNTLKRLSLRGAVTRFGMIGLCHGLRENSTLIKLEVDFDLFTGDSAAEFAAAMRVNKTLRIVSFFDPAKFTGGRRVCCDIVPIVCAVKQSHRPGVLRIEFKDRRLHELDAEIIANIIRESEAKGNLLLDIRFSGETESRALQKEFAGVPEVVLEYDRILSRRQSEPLVMVYDARVAYTFGSSEDARN